MVAVVADPPAVEALVDAAPVMLVVARVTVAALADPVDVDPEVLVVPADLEVVDQEAPAVPVVAVPAMLAARAIAAALATRVTAALETQVVPATVVPVDLAAVALVVLAAADGKRLGGFVGHGPTWSGVPHWGS